MVTERQKLAVQFCEQQLEIKFEGSLDNLSDIHDFLSKHLDNAKKQYYEDREIYEQVEKGIRKMKRDAMSLCK